MASYTPAAGDVVYAGASAATELLSRVGGVIAGCGFAAFAVVANAVNGTSTSPAQVTAIITQAIAEGQAGRGGVATPRGIEHVAQTQGITLQSQNWQSAITQYAGVKPIEIGLGNANALGGADLGVKGHYITVVGRTASGRLIVSDPNTAESKAGQFVTYSTSQLAAAQPFWAAVPTQGLATRSSGAQPSNASQSSSATIGGLNIPNPVDALSNSVFASAFQGFQTGATSALHQVGWFILALVIIGAGAWLLFGSEVKEAAQGIAKSATGGAPGGSKGEGEGGEAGEASGAGEAAGAEGADVAALAV